MLDTTTAPSKKASKYAYAAESSTTRSYGFTLLEVILAIAITGFLLAGATAFVISVSNIWVDREERNFFEDHVDGVSEFLRASFSNAGMEIALDDRSEDTSTTTNNEPSGNGPVEINVIEVNTPDEASTSPNTNGSTSSSNGGLLRASEEPVGWANPPGFAEYKDPLLNFKLTSTPPLLINIDNAPTIGIDAFLYFEPNEGLSLLWYSLLQEEVEDTEDMRRTEISPLVTGIKYIYWDERFEKWEEEEEPMQGDGNDEFLLPRFIKLTFEYEDETKERTLAIPVPSTNILLF